MPWTDSMLKYCCWVIPFHVLKTESQHSFHSFFMVVFSEFWSDHLHGSEMFRCPSFQVIFPHEHSGSCSHNQQAHMVFLILQRKQVYIKSAGDVLFIKSNHTFVKSLLWKQLRFQLQMIGHLNGIEA